MTLREAKGNMYDWVTKTRNYLGGECEHKCEYCYVNYSKDKFPNIKLKYSGNIKLIQKELDKQEGNGNVIFVQNMSDLFAENVPKKFILKILVHCKKYPNNKYVFQTKNPKRFIEFVNYFPDSSYLGVTIETNRKNFNYRAPQIQQRIKEFSRKELNKFHKFLTLEPIMDFDLKEFVGLIKLANPTWVNIGADSKKHNLPEPSKKKILGLIDELNKFTEIRKKSNLVRLADIEDL